MVIDWTERYGWDLERWEEAARDELDWFRCVAMYWRGYWHAAVSWESAGDIACVMCVSHMRSHAILMAIQRAFAAEERARKRKAETS